MTAGLFPQKTGEISKSIMKLERKMADLTRAANRLETVNTEETRYALDIAGAAVFHAKEDLWLVAHADHPPTNWTDEQRMARGHYPFGK